MTIKNQSEKKSVAAWWQPAVGLCIELGGWVAGPVIAAMFIGRWLDDRYASAPLWYFTAVGVAFIISTVGIAKTAVKAMRDMDRLAKQEKEDHEQSAK